MGMNVMPLLQKNYEVTTCGITPKDMIQANLAQMVPELPQQYDVVLHAAGKAHVAPKTEEEKQTSNDVIQEGLYNMGLILKDKLEDYASSSREFNELLDRYPDNIYRLDVYYNMYLMYMRMGDLVVAEKYRTLILGEFADSKYGMAMKDPHYLDNLRNMGNEQEIMYARAYENYLSNNNSEVH